jgi:hypothetical protein
MIHSHIQFAEAAANGSRSMVRCENYAFTCRQVLTILST